jgi:hypothetical protein
MKPARKMSNQKVPGTMVVYCNVSTYDNAYIIIIRAGPLCAHPLAPLNLQLFGGLVEGIFRNLPEIGRSFDPLSSIFKDLVG